MMPPAETQTPGPRAWDRFNRWNRRDRAMSRAWVLKLCEAIRARGLIGPDSRVLDFGCGYFDAGLILAPHVARMDGYDPFAPALREARAALRDAERSRLYGDPGAIPRGAYDLVLVNSVVQYMNTTAEFRATLAVMKECLAPARGSAILLSDLLPRNYAAVRDAVEVFAYACRRGLAAPMARHVVKAALFTRRKAYLKLDEEDLRDAAAGLGFAVRRLDENLTPSRRRYTCLLELE